MRHSILLSSLSAASIAASASATVIGNQVFGDAYLVRDGATTYSVLDVYVKSVNNTQNDRFANVAGIDAYKSAFVQRDGLQFRHAGNSSWRPNFTGGATAGSVAMPDGITYGLHNQAWDSFVTSGLRYQSNDGGGATALQLTPTFFTNFSAANAGTIAGNTSGTNGGAGWYPLAGGTAASNPFCQFSYYNGQTGAVNTAKAATTISGNGITAGQSLDNHFMIGRFTIDVTNWQFINLPTMSLKFAMVVVSDGVQKSGAVDANFRVDQTLSFAVPSPAAGAMLALAGVCGRRRRG